jgi:short-subunit dehydrogenase
MDSKVVVITGASGGIGAALARELGQAGHKLALAARREEELKRVSEETGGPAIAVICDVKQRGDLERLRDATLNEFGRVDVWINNAGRGVSKRVLELEDEQFDEIIDVNLKSAWYGMQTIIPYFQSQRKGHLINISSFLGRVPFVTFRSIYSASKAALNVLTTNLRMDLAMEYPEIRISLVMPGVVKSDFSKNALGGIPQGTPIKGIMQPQTTEEAAAAIATLLENPRPELYTNPALEEIARQYSLDKLSFEEKLRQASKT